MTDVTIKATKRDGQGKGPCRRTRAAGSVPAVLYGHKIEAAINIQIDPKEITRALKTPWGNNAIVTLEVEGAGSHRVMAREIQRHPVSRRVRHIDFVAPNPDREIITLVPLNVHGKSVGVTTGGKLRQPYREIRVKAKPHLLPAQIDVDITNLDKGETIMASHLALPEGVRVVYDNDYVIAKVFAPRGAKKDGEE